MELNFYMTQFNELRQSVTHLSAIFLPGKKVKEPKEQNCNRTQATFVQRFSNLAAKNHTPGNFTGNARVIIFPGRANGVRKLVMSFDGKRTQTFSDT